VVYRFNWFSFRFTQIKFTENRTCVHARPSPVSSRPHLDAPGVHSIATQITTQASLARGREAEFTQVGGWDVSSDSDAGHSAVEESDRGDSVVEGSDEGDSAVEGSEE